MSKNKKIKWGSLTSKYVGNPYELGKVDCFRLMLDVMDDMKVKIPPLELDGLDIDNYPQAFEKDPAGTKEVMVKWLQTFTDKIDKKDMLPGDILLLEAKRERVMFCAIYTGNNKIMSASEHRVGVYKLQFFNILRALRVKNGNNTRSQLEEFLKKGVN